MTEMKEVRFAAKILGRTHGLECGFSEERLAAAIAEFKEAYMNGMKQAELANSEDANRV